MSVGDVYTHERITQKAKALFAENRARKRLDGWFRIKEIQRDCDGRYADLPLELRASMTLREAVRRLPLTLSENAVFAGTQDDAFARSYALINPAFRVESFSGYCDPTAVFDDIEPGPGITREHIESLREYNRETDYVRALSAVYKEAEAYTSEVVFFIEQVTGHLIPDMRPILRHGVRAAMETLSEKAGAESDPEKKNNYEAMNIALESPLILAGRYADLAREQARTAGPERKAELSLLIRTLERVPANGAGSLYEAIQSYLLLWQAMCIEQAPNPFAFSVGNADRIFEPYRAAETLDRETAAALFRHFLVFFNVGDRSWAISQNVIVGGKSSSGGDLTCETTFALLDAYYGMNLPQPILSVKLHKNTPEKLYGELGKFFLTPGMLTPSLFNDDSVFEVLRGAGVEEADLEDYSIAGCQEPLIMGRDNGNTTNSWLNLGKILELTLSGGYSTVTGKRIGRRSPYADARERLAHLRELFYENVEFDAAAMAKAANGASKALSNLRVPLLSALMGGIGSGYDVRDTERQGTKYNGSGCLIHGLTVVADSFIAVDRLLAERPQDAERLIGALRADFAGDEALRRYLLAAPKFGNHIAEADDEAEAVARKVADIVSAQLNYLGNPFRPDFSTPSTHLLYGYWVGATPDGRRSRDMLNYGVDPLYGDAQNGLGFRILSGFRLPYLRMRGGYASHFGLDPRYFAGESDAEKGIAFRDRVINPLFFNDGNGALSPYYLYVNVTTAEILRKVLANPKKYAPGGVYILRIHGTFVNFLDLSPAIQQDIITRLAPASTAM